MARAYSLRRALAATPVRLQPLQLTPNLILTEPSAILLVSGGLNRTLLADSPELHTQPPKRDPLHDPFWCATRSEPLDLSSSSSEKHSASETRAHPRGGLTTPTRIGSTAVASLHASIHGPSTMANTQSDDGIKNSKYPWMTNPANKFGLFDESDQRTAVATVGPARIGWDLTCS